MERAREGAGEGGTRVSLAPGAQEPHMPPKTRFASPPSPTCPLQRRHLLQEAVNHPQDTAFPRLRNSRTPQPPSPSPLPLSHHESRGDPTLYAASYASLADSHEFSIFGIKGKGEGERRGTKRRRGRGRNRVPHLPSHSKAQNMCFDATVCLHYEIRFKRRILNT